MRLCSAHGKFRFSLPFSSSAHSEEFANFSLAERWRCRRLIKMVNCLRGGNDDKEGERREREREEGGSGGHCVFAGFLGRFSLSPSFGSCRVTWDSSLVFLRRRPILRSFSTTQYLPLRMKQGVTRPLALRVPRPLSLSPSFVPSRVSSSSPLFFAAVQTRALSRPRTRVSLSAAKHSKISHNSGHKGLLKPLSLLQLLRGADSFILQCVSVSLLGERATLYFGRRRQLWNCARG